LTTDGACRTEKRGAARTLARIKAQSASLFLLGFLALPPAHTQETQRVIVTGSNLKRASAEGPAAVQVVTRAEIARSGRQSVAEIVHALTADGNGSLNEAVNPSFAAGAAGVSLRGLSVSSTLVLLNGRRTAPYGLADGGQRQFVDLDTLPLDAVERIEVLKDGASAIYGSDAIAGVVNIMLRRDYAGSGVTLTEGGSTRGDGALHRAVATWGRGSLAADGYNLFATVEARRQDEILQRDRADSFLGSSDTRAIGGNDRRLGKSDPVVTSTGNNFYGSVLRRNADGSAIPDLWYEQLPGCPPDVAAASAAAPRNGAGGCLWDPVAFARIVPASSRLNLYARLSAALGAGMTGHLEVFAYAARHSNRSRPSSITNTWPDVANDRVLSNGLTLLLPAGHPDNPYPDSPARVRYTPGTLPRSDSFDTRVLRLLAGVTGTLAGWEYDAALVSASSRTASVGEAYVRASALTAAIADGTFRIGRNAGLTPPAVLAAVYPRLVSAARTTMRAADVKATRDLAPLPGGPLALAVGIETRRETVDAPPHPLMAQADIVGLSYTAVSGDRGVAAIYAEVAAPLTRALELQAAVRTDRYSDYGRSTTPKLALRYAFSPAYAVRASLAAGFRAPGAAENGGSAQAGFSAFNNDPLRCPATGLAQDCVERNNIVLITTGNPSLRPERSRSSGLGLILAPARDVAATFDFWRIARTDEILPAGAARIVADPASMPGARVVRGEPTPAFPLLPGPILAVTAPYMNGRATTTYGLDADVRARLPVAAGRLTLHGQATYLARYRVELDSGERLDYAGTHGPVTLSGNAGMPRVKAAVETAWEDGPWHAAVRAAYVAGLRDTDHAGGACLDVAEDTGLPVRGCRVGSFTSVDLTLGHALPRGWSVNLAVRNLFDRAPPFDIQSLDGINYSPTLHNDGAVGRYVTLSLSWRR
jgi:iron complex outermembrane receptor protein